VAPQAGDPLDAGARAWLDDPGPDVLAAIAEKRRFVAAVARWPPDERAWTEVRGRLAEEMAGFPAVERALDVAGIPAAPGFLGIDDDLLRGTLRYANRLRARYTVLDFLEGQGALDEAIDAALGPLTSDRGRGGG
jgi:hypothetical protein